MSGVLWRQNILFWFLGLSQSISARALLQFFSADFSISIPCQQFSTSEEPSKFLEISNIWWCSLVSQNVGKVKRKSLWNNMNYWVVRIAGLSPILETLENWIHYFLNQSNNESWVSRTALMYSSSYIDLTLSVIIIWVNLYI